MDPSKRFSRHLAPTVLIAGVLLLLSLALYSRRYTGWEDPGRFHIDVTHSAFGVPHWLTFNRWDIQGTQQQVDPRELPEGELLPPGWHLNLGFLAASLAGSIALAIPLSFLFHWARPKPAFGPYGIAMIPAAVTGALVPTDPEWIGFLLALILLPLCLAAAALRLRSFVSSALAGAGMVATLWWTARLVDVFRTKHLDHGLPDTTEWLAVAILTLIALMIAFVSTAAASWWRKGDRHGGAHTNVWFL